MSYKVLYRKYRPDSFEGLIGQKAIVEILKNSIIEQKIAHAYMFSGPRGTGKTSTARILAKSVNCLEPKDGIACGSCQNCQNFNTSPDIIEIDAASNNGVDEIRELINNVKIMPTMLKYKVYIIDEVHMLTPSAFNALLLTLEEPPSHVIFILATTNLEKVPITILSRCQKFDFKRIQQKDVLKQLTYICEEEKISYDEEALEEIAALSDGGMRDALSILDQLSKSTDKITLESVIKDVGSISNQRIKDLIEAVDQNEVDNIVHILDEFRNSSLNYKVVIKKMMDYIAYLAVEVLKNGIKCHLDYDDYKKIIIELNDMMNKINVSVDPYLILEVILLGFIKTAAKPTEITKEKEMEAKETISKEKEEEKAEKKQEISPEKPQITKDETTEQDEFQQIRINNCFVKATKEDLNRVKEEWKQFLDNETSAKTKGLVADTVPVLASDSYIIIETTIKHQDKELNQATSLIEESFKRIVKKSYKMIFIEDSLWQKEKEKYIKNLQSGCKYQMKDESTTTMSVKKEDTNIEDIATDIFDMNKIEVK